MGKISCVCGCENFETVDRQVYQVSREGVTSKVENESTALGRCTDCGIIRQLEMPFIDEQEYLKYYQTQYAPVGAGYKAKDYTHDLKLAGLRCNDYGVKAGLKILDVGSGSGAFVDEARRLGAEAYGCEIGKYHYAGKADEEFVYRARFEDINFPTDYFDMVVCHDVLEHVLNPVKFISELLRVTKQQGICFLDFPRYFDKAGQHHWKRFEHIWFFSQEQLHELLANAGFKVESIERPIESKLLFKLVKLPRCRPSVLVPPGMGDSYWTIVKMRAFLKREGLGLPDLAVVCPREKKYDGHRRSFPFLEMFPFVHSSGINIDGSDPTLQPIWKEAYMRPGRTIFQNVGGFDYFIAYNGHLRVGESLEQVDPDLKCEWIPPMFVSLEQERFRQNMLTKYGNYMIFYFAFQGTYKYWVQEFKINELVNSVNNIAKKTGLTPVVAGERWDRDNTTVQRVIKAIPGAVDMTGRTSLEQLFGMIRGAKAVFGFPSGLTIMSTVLGQKTLILWNDFYMRKFQKFACPPETWNNTYFAENTLNLSSDYLAAWAIEKIAGVKNNITRPVLPPQETMIDVKTSSTGKLFLPKARLRCNRLAKVPISQPKQGQEFTVVCVLKTGGDFDAQYVINLKRMLERNLTVPFRFICLTDLDRITGCEIFKLRDDLAGWWSKIEIFRPGLLGNGLKIYFDLDTVIIDNVDELAFLGGDLYGLRPWNQKNRAAGEMAAGLIAWRGNTCDFIYEKFNKAMLPAYRSPQDYISKTLNAAGKSWVPIQDVFQSIKSFKRECRHGTPPGTRIVCFHGRPRVHECETGWVKRAWL